MTGLVWHLPPVDRLDHPDGALLLYEHRLVSVSVLGAAVLDRATTPVAPTDLAAPLAAEFGEPAHGSIGDALEGVVAELVRAGVLEWLR
ncbi:MAG TPA: hypothetical protein DEG88_02045 [Propionibacteriaceae bacterium]|nr:hypothetical protein [Propionibacteriaceae bacterium]HBY22110.1 hypothetical protein [Propionibacteriaceae bacterium]